MYTYNDRPAIKRNHYVFYTQIYIYIYDKKIFVL